MFVATVYNSNAAAIVVGIVDGTVVGIELFVGTACIASRVGNGIVVFRFVGMGHGLGGIDTYFYIHSDVGGYTFDLHLVGNIEH